MRRLFWIAAFLLAVCGRPAVAQFPGDGPWNRDLALLESADGVRFGSPRRFVERGGVPSVIRDAKERLLAAFQWFPLDRREAFDRIAVMTSGDEGKTWSRAQTIAMTGFPAGWMRPCDPTLALLDDGRVRLYFTADPHDGHGPGTYSAISSDGVSYTFEPGARFRVEGETVLDCAVARLGRQWHYYAPIQGTPGRGYHAVSDDGLRFTRQADVSLPGAGNWLGCVVPVKEGLRFYGTGRGVWSAFSRDGVTWRLDPGTHAAGADPGVVVTRDGRTLMIATGELRPEARAALGPGGGPPPSIPALAAHGEFVYVVRDGVLYQFDAKDLRLLRRTRLTEDPPK